MEGKCNATKVVKGGVNAGQEGEGIVVKNKKQNFTRWMDVLDCSNPLISPLLKALAALQGNSCSKGSKIKQGGNKGRQEGKGIVRKQHAIVIMGTDVLGCPVCSTPLSPPIFQCSLGHFVCLACRDKLPGTERACSVCSRPVSDRCHGVERIVGSVLVPCSYYAHGCTNVIAYHRKGEHEKACRHAPCFCPVNGCGFAGTTEVLLDHFTTKHKWPITVFKYYEPFDVPVKVGMHVLHGSAEDEDKDNDSNLFLLNVGSPGSRLHEVSLVRIQAHEQEYGIGCSMGFSWFRGQYQVVTLDIIKSSSLSNGLLECCVCTVPQVRRGGAERVVLSVTIGLDSEEGDDAEDGHSEVDDSKKAGEADRHNAE